MGRRSWALPLSGRRGPLSGRDGLAQGWGGTPRQSPPPSLDSGVLGAPCWLPRGCSPRSRRDSCPAAAQPAVGGSGGGEGRAGVRVGRAGGTGAVRLSLPARSLAASSPGACGTAAPRAQLLRAPRRLRFRPRRSLRRSPLLSKRPSLAAAAGRKGATAGCCRAASGGREPSARSRHLELRQRAGVREPRKGPGGAARGARSAGV